MRVLVLNSGSSSQKACLYELGETLPDNPAAFLWEARIEWEAERATVFVNSRGAAKQERIQVASRADAVQHLLTRLWSGPEPILSSPSEIDVVGHRVVHGGPDCTQPVLVSPEVKERISGASEFAPLQNRAELEGMEIVASVIDAVPQVAVFDTGFHSRMPLPAVVYPGPYEWFTTGIRRYGFHGINHQYCAERAAHLLGNSGPALRLVSCHLGNGCSLAAIVGGQSIDTTMGLTPLEGLMMGTRSGSVDPGILTYLMRRDHVNGDQLDDLLNHKSGLLGISGKSSDMRQIMTGVKDGDVRSELAFDIYVHRLRAGIGAMVASLGGVDALVFTAGVGENSPEVRSATCNNLRFLGLKLNEEKNTYASPDGDVAESDSAVRVLVIRAQEDWAIARECWNLMGKEHQN